MLQTQDLTYTYRRGTPLRFPDLHCAAGEQWLLLGQSGTGKTTLLHVLGGLRSPGSGMVKVAGLSLQSLSRARLDHFRGQKIGIIFQTPHFVRALTVGENLALTQRLAGRAADRRRIQELLDHLNIGHKLNDKPDRLSAGEQQRVAIARALINQPALLLADEPTSALDDHNCERVIDLIERQASEEGATLLVVTHDNRLKAKFENHIYLQA